jgi:uncharacterized membrane protein
MLIGRESTTSGTAPDEVPIDLRVPPDTLRRLAAAVSGVVTVLYAMFMVLVWRAETDIEIDTTWGAYLYLALLYAVTTVLLATVDRRWLHLGLAVLQGVVLALFVVFAVGTLGPEDAGVFEYEALDELPVELFAWTITTLQVALLVMLGWLGLPPRSPVAAPPGDVS